ncbi:MAG TPA: hypothetical protein VGT05_04930 [Patescibacteria group bacterium]|nr:hypothetical protein [Patescibacteria group bacterium]
MIKPLHVTKIVASSTYIAWAQAYHAGGLTALLAIKKKDNEEHASPSLSIIGKDLLNTFESEYFTLETKNLNSIGKAVETTYNKSAKTHEITLIVVSSVQNALYVFLAGSGSVQLLRKGKMGVLLEKKASESEEILAASGFLEDHDVIVLETDAFSKIIPSDNLFKTLSENGLDETAELLSPKVHEVQEGSAAALFFSYKEEKSMLEPLEKSEEKRQEKIPDEIIQKATQPLLQSTDTTESKKERKSLTHRQKLFLSIAVILILVLAATIYLSLQKAQEAKTAAVFKSIYPPAQQKYQEGQSLLNLNADEARSDFQQAISLLQNGKGKFPANSSQEKQIDDLLAKAEQGLMNTSQVNTTQLAKIDSSANPLLAFEGKQHATYVTSDSTNFYVADTTGITRYDQKTNASKMIIKNSSNWKIVGGFGTYLGNFYLLDKNGGILKYVSAGSTYSSTYYFASGVKPDLSHAVSLAIDGSIWVVTSDGSILKFTKGNEDTFSLIGLDKPFSAPSHIVTSIDDSNVYVLDNGNSRLVILDKTGKYIAQYQSQRFKQATDMTVDEKNKKVDVLIGNDIYELTFK